MNLNPWATASPRFIVPDNMLVDAIGKIYFNDFSVKLIFYVSTVWKIPWERFRIFLSFRFYVKSILKKLELFPDKLLHEICLHFRLLMYCVLTKFRSNVPAKILL